jgi:hypothetical protein
MDSDLCQLRNIFTSQNRVTDLLELLFASSLYPTLDIRLPRFIAPAPLSSCESAYHGQFVEAWKSSAPVELLLRGAELVEWSRTSLPNQFQNIVKRNSDDVRDVSHLLLHRSDVSNKLYNLATLLADPDGLRMVTEDNFSHKLETARRMRAV